MYICTDCGRTFEEPTVTLESEYIEGRHIPFRSESCPHCGGANFSEADECPDCGAYKHKGNKLCPACSTSLAKKFVSFSDFLTAAEEEQIDDWLDGISVRELRGKLIGGSNGQPFHL